MAGLGTLGLVAWGTMFWDWGTDDIEASDEGWLEDDTRFGGADKLGHFSVTYFSTAILSAVHRGLGFSRREAALRAALTSMLWWTVVEVGDGTVERHGFSPEDLVADALGAGLGYLHETSPWVNRVIDIRMEYVPSKYALEEAEDPLSDYWGMTYLVAINVGGLTRRRPGLLDLLDVQVGYRTRGYQVDEEQERWLFAGVGLNLANLMRRLSIPGAKIFDYYQVPYISLRYGVELNSGESDFLWGP